MSKTLVLALSALGLAFMPAVIPASRAEAGIVCKGGFQRSGGTWIATPYCEDAALARAAREHGKSVSGSELRANPNKKDEVCRFLSRSPAAEDYCSGDNSDNG
ncbi:MAG: hypothetical protein AB7S70_13570 [Hyphomicrobium sp.]|uniref:hypothetical protein n=1 Tax=Hyphomicrobium sp. TaxID=82 RepID=UPI003D12BCFE